MDKLTAEAHLRIDEMERTLAGIPERVKLDELFERMDKLMTAMASVMLSMETLAASMAKPVERTGRLQLPSGPVTMTLSERRG